MLLELKSMVKILIRPPIKDFLSSFLPIKSLNLSNTGWNMSLMMSPKPTVESLSSTGSSKTSLNNFIYNFCFGLISIPFLLEIFVFFAWHFPFICPFRYFCLLFLLRANGYFWRGFLIWIFYSIMIYLLLSVLGGIFNTFMIKKEVGSTCINF